MPRTFNNLYERIYTLENLYSAYLKARRNKRYRPEVLEFSYSQVGIFYRIMFEDARRVADKLGLKLMVKGEAGCPVELCGFPESGLDKYVGRLARQGFSTVICRQARGENGGAWREASEVVRCLADGGKDVL